MRSRVKAFAKGKNVVTYPFNVEAHGDVDHQQVMRATYDQLARKVRVCACVRACVRVDVGDRRFVSSVQAQRARARVCVDGVLVRHC